MTVPRVNLRFAGRHWYSGSEDMFCVGRDLFTVIGIDGTHVSRPGDGAIWPAGISNTYVDKNYSHAPFRYLVIGVNTSRDTANFPDLRRARHVGPEGWRLLDGGSAEIESGSAV
ncbi:MAG: hypothetical protein ACK5II_10980 [Paracoccus sp. (in: a-proteobacteria)]